MIYFTFEAVLFAVVDIETTGGSADNSGITEIAVIVTNGQDILETFETLVDPQKYIPPFITNLTGITNEMVESAPTFSQIAPKIYSLLKEKVFVAHNVNFDYSFVKKQLAESGFPITEDKLCTVKYTRKIDPGHSSYSLSNICLRMGINNKAAHRAMGDTAATATLLHQMLARDTEKEWEKMVFGKRQFIHLPTHLDPDVFHQLTEETGVYYLKGKKGEILYIGKAKNIKTRIKQHFSGDKSAAKNQSIYRNVAHIDVVLTGSELMATLIEDSEIRRYWPPLNKAQKTRIEKHHLCYYQDQNQNWRLCVLKGKVTGRKLTTVFSFLDARERMIDLVKTHSLHPTYCQIDVPELQNISVEDHNSNFQNMLQSIDKMPENYVVYTSGTKSGESGFLVVREKLFIGYGFIPNHKKSTRYEDLIPQMKPAVSSPFSARFIDKHVQTNIDLDVAILQFENTPLLFG